MDAIALGKPSTYGVRGTVKDDKGMVLLAFSDHSNRDYILDIKEKG